MMIFRHNLNSVYFACLYDFQNFDIATKLQIDIFKDYVVLISSKFEVILVHDLASFDESKFEKLTEIYYNQVVIEELGIDISVMAPHLVLKLQEIVDYVLVLLIIV